MAVPNGSMFCEMIKFNFYGSDVFQTSVYKSENEEYKLVHKTYPTGKKRRALTDFKKCCNNYLRKGIRIKNTG